MPKKKHLPLPLKIKRPEKQSDSPVQTPMHNNFVDPEIQSRKKQILRTYHRNKTFKAIAEETPEELATCTTRETQPISTQKGPIYSPKIIIFQSLSSAFNYLAKYDRANFNPYYLIFHNGIMNTHIFQARLPNMKERVRLQYNTENKSSLLNSFLSFFKNHKVVSKKTATDLFIEEFLTLKFIDDAQEAEKFCTFVNKLITNQLDVKTVEQPDSTNAPMKN